MTATRRNLLRASSAAAVASLLDAQAPNAPYRLYWGDLHNHNSVGYAQGSIERTYDIARGHLDFLAFTPHAQWHDMPAMPNNAHLTWVKGFAALRDNWEKVRRLAHDSNRPGEFVSLLAYEWHSSFFGDYCLYYPDEGPLAYFDDVRKLQRHAQAANALIIPHHLAYRQGLRGANFNFFDPSVSPILEIYSEHGLSEQDRGGRDYITHSNGGRWTRNTLRAFLRKGLRAGVIASTDDHLGYPGAYGEGLAGVYAPELTRAGLFEALRARRTIAATGDRIGLVFRLNGRWMGSSLAHTRHRELTVEARGADEIERIEVLKNDRVIHRYFPEDALGPLASWPAELLSRVEFGWGPWGALAMNRTCDWDFDLRLDTGKILDAVPCFQSGPYDEKRRNRIERLSDSTFRAVSYTSRTDAYAERATNAVILRIAAPPSAWLELTLRQPRAMSIRRKLGDLIESSEVELTGPFQSESVLLHRLVRPEMYRVSTRLRDLGKAGQTDWYYARVYQSNGHQAWSSPIWVER